MTGEFRKLWIGQSISAVGSQVTLIALPLTAAFSLGSTPQEMGFLVAAQWLPYPVFGLFAGAWADRLRRKPILIATDIGRALVLATIPIAALAGALTIGHVLVAAFAATSLTVLFRAAYSPFIPVLVPRDALVDANAKLALSESVARVAGPSLGGVLVQLVTAPITILIDAVSFVISAVALVLVRATESPPPRAARRAIWAEMGEGMRVVIGNAFIRSVTIIGSIFNLAITIGDAVLILYFTRELGLDGAMVGALYTIGGLASVAGATLVRRVTGRFGIGPSMAGAIFLFVVGQTLILVASGPPLVATVYLAGRGVLVAFGAAVFNVSSASLYQAAVPIQLQGRVGGAGQVLGLGLIPVAAIAGGWLGEHIGLWNTIAISTAGQVLGLIYVASSPLRAIRTPDDLPPIAAAQGGELPA
ncbi:MAG: MFS transporter [Chloroflexi bacterium]|nr:MAG: MFS transporter [Chloroflexota bacterium]